MKNLFSLFIAFLFLGCTLSEQEQLKLATDSSQEMAELYNSRDFEAYSQVLLPTIAGTKKSSRSTYASLLEDVTRNDNRKLSNIKVLHAVINRSKGQVLFSAQFGGKSRFIGIRHSRNRWLFTNTFPEKRTLSGILQDIPELDSSFFDLVDPKWQQRNRFIVGQPVPDISWQTMDGQTIDKSVFSGKKTLVNFWHPSCGPCIQEMPDLNQLVVNHPNVQFLGPTWSEDASAFAKSLESNFFKSYAFLYQTVIFHPDDNDITVYPTHLVVDENQQIIDVFTGYSKANIERLASHLRE